MVLQESRGRRCPALSVSVLWSFLAFSPFLSVLYLLRTLIPVLALFFPRLGSPWSLPHHSHCPHCLEANLILPQHPEPHPSLLYPWHMSLTGQLIQGVLLPGARPACEPRVQFVHFQPLSLSLTC